MSQCLEHIKDLFLGRLVEVDQQVAAEHKIVGWLIRQQCRVQQVADLQAHLFAHSVGDAITACVFSEVAVAKFKVGAAKRVLAVHTPPRALHRQRADIHALHFELVGRQPRIEQGHGNRIGLFAGRTRQAENTQGAHLVDLGQACLGQASQGCKGFGIAEKPGLGDDHRFDQRLLLVMGGLQVLPVSLRRRRLGRLAALAHRAFDDRLAHRRDVQADAFFQEREKPRVIAHRLNSAQNNKARTGAVNRSATPIHCIKPWASSRTGPRYGACWLSRP